MILSMLSGGPDSAFMVRELALANIEQTVIHVPVKAKDGPGLVETRAARAIMDFIEAECGRKIPLVVADLVDLGAKGLFNQDTYAPIAGGYLRRNPDIDTICISYYMNDWYSRLGFTDTVGEVPVGAPYETGRVAPLEVGKRYNCADLHHWNPKITSDGDFWALCLKHAQRDDWGVEHPHIYMTKDEMFHLMPRKLWDMSWSCPCPIDDDSATYGARPCGTCLKCKERAEIDT